MIWIVRLSAALALLAAGAWAQRSGLLAGLREHWSDVVYLSREHIRLVAISAAAAAIVGVPLGVLVTRPALRWLAAPVVRLASLGTTVPTLAILALAMTVLGLGARSAIFGLTVLTLLPILLNTVAGLQGIAPELREAARGMGMTDRQVLREVELPNAALVIWAGFRTALAINVGTVPLAFLIGGGGLGELIFSGIDLMEPSLLLAGALATATLALILDTLVAAVQRWLTPRGLRTI